MKILHVIPTIDPATGGPIEGLKQLISIYQEGNHEIEVASFEAPEQALKFSFPAKVHALGPSLGTYGYSRHAAPWFRQNIANYDVVLINGVWNYNAVVAQRAARRTKIPYAVFTHGMLDPYFKRRYPLKHVKKTIYWHSILRTILHDAKAVLFTCEEEKILARQSFPRYQVTEIVVPYGTFGPDCDLHLAAADFLARWPHLQGKRLAVSMGRIHPKKGIDILIQAFAQTLARNPAWHLVIAGPDPVGLRNQLEALAGNLGIADRMTFTGMLNGPLKWGAFAASEVFALPSHQENFGIVVAEAMAASLPIIVSDKVNIWREVVGCNAGFVNEDTVDGTKASLDIWSALTPEEIADTRVHSHACFNEHFNYEVTSKRVLWILDHIRGSQGSGRVVGQPDITKNGATSPLAEIPSERNRSSRKC